MSTDFDMGPYERRRNGVVRRGDGAGDAWANGHRNAPRSWYMNDIDALFGTMAFGINGGDTVFVEFEPDSPRNKGKAIRKFGLVALFDRKNSNWAAHQSDVSLGLYLDICRAFRDRGQPFPPRFFYVIGGQEPPWDLVEVCISSGTRKPPAVIMTDTSRAEWERVWRALGLVESRDAIRAWMNRWGA